jgi:hypothetical protein
LGSPYSGCPHPKFTIASYSINRAKSFVTVFATVAGRCLEATRSSRSDHIIRIPPARAGFENRTTSRPAIIKKMFEIVV